MGRGSVRFAPLRPHKDPHESGCGLHPRRSARAQEQGKAPAPDLIKGRRSLIVTSVSSLAAIGLLAKGRTLTGIVFVLIACLFATLYCVALSPETLLNGLMAFTVFALLLATALFALYSEMTASR